MYYWDDLDNMITSVSVVGNGILRGKRILFIENGPFTTWVDESEVSDQITEKMRSLSEREKRRTAYVPKRI